MKTGWQPIDTAPKSGMRTPRIDLWVHEPHKGGYRVTDAFWSRGMWKIKVQLGLHIAAFSAGHSPVYWRLRPSPPAEYPLPAGPRR